MHGNLSDPRLTSVHMMWNAGGLPSEPPGHAIGDKRDGLVAHLDAAHNLANWLLRDRSEAEDAVQDAYVRALRHYDSLRGHNHRSWLLSIVRNCCYDRIRARTSDVPFDDHADVISDERPNPEVSLLNNESAQGLEDVLGALAAEMREILVLRELEGMSYKDVASVTGLPVGTVMSRLSRARAQLQRLAVLRLANRRGA